MKTRIFVDGLIKTIVPSTKSEVFVDGLIKTIVPSTKSDVFVDRPKKMTALSS